MTSVDAKTTLHAIEDWYAADREKRLRLAQGLCPLCGGETLPFDDDNPFGEKKSVCRERECKYLFYDASGAPVEAAYDGTDLIGSGLLAIGSEERNG